MQSKNTTARGAQGPDRPTLLMVGSGDPMDAALKVALDRHGLFVETVGGENLRRSIHLTAPDLVLLVGDAAKGSGAAALAELAADSSTAAIPVVLLAPDEQLESRMHAFRHGATAVVPRGASADAIAREVRRLSREMSEQFEERTGEIGEATFDDLVEIVKKELRSGILSVHAPGHKGGPMRLVLGAGRPVTEAVQEFVARLSPHVKQAAADPMYYQFHASAGGPVELLGGEGQGGGDLRVLEQVRVLLVDDDPARADTLAQELRARGAIVFVTDTEGRGLERASGLDPHVALVDASGLEGPGFEVVRAIRKDLRLRWASILVAPWDEIWPAGAPTPDMEQLASRIAPLLAPERDLEQRSAGEEPFDTRLEATGPSRMLRVLVGAGGGALHLTARNPKAVVEVDVAEGLVVGAKAQMPKGEALEGAAALGVLLSLASGRVHVERRPNPSVANVMSPVEEALSAASAEPSRVPASVPPVGGASGRASAIDRVHVPLDEDTDPESTRVKNLSGLAHASEALLDADKPTMRPPELPVDPKESRRTPLPPPETPVGGPVAASERRRPPARRKATLVMGAPAIPPAPADPPEAPAAEPPQGPPPVPKPPPRLKGTMVGMQAVTGERNQASGSAADAGNPTPEEPSGPGPTGADPDTAVLAAAEATRPPAPGLPPTPPVPSAGAALVPDETAAERRAAAREPTDPRVPHATPRVRPSAARRVAQLAVGVAAVVLVAVLGLIGYRYSGQRVPVIDRALVTLGVPPVADAPPSPADEGADTGAAGGQASQPVDTGETPGGEPGTAEAAAGTDEAAAGTDEAAADEPPDGVSTDDVVADDGVTDDVAPDEAASDEAASDERVDPAEEEATADATGEDEDEDDGSTAEQLADRARRAGNSDLAERLYRRALAIDPQEHHAMVGLARLLMDRNENAEAAELLRGAIRRRPRRAPYRIWLGDALAAAGNGAGAQRAWREALEIDPDNRQARRRLGQ